MPIGFTVEMPSNAKPTEGGRLLALWRLQNNLSQNALARELELHPIAISRWETGLSRPSPEHMELLEETTRRKGKRIMKDPFVPRSAWLFPRTEVKAA